MSTSLIIAPLAYCVNCGEGIYAGQGRTRDWDGPLHAACQAPEAAPMIADTTDADQENPVWEETTPEQLAAAQAGQPIPDTYLYAVASRSAGAAPHVVKDHVTFLYCQTCHRSICRHAALVAAYLAAHAPTRLADRKARDKALTAQWEARRAAQRASRGPVGYGDLVEDNADHSRIVAQDRGLETNEAAA